MRRGRRAALALPVIYTLLTWPALFVFAVPGLLLSWLFRPRRRKTGMFKS